MCQLLVPFLITESICIGFNMFSLYSFDLCKELIENMFELTYILLAKTIIGTDWSSYDGRPD